MSKPELIAMALTFVAWIALYPRTSTRTIPHDNDAIERGDEW